MYTSIMNNAVRQISDAELYSRCKHYGEIARKYKWKFAGLLPEIFRRKLFEKKGYGSIFEFAAKMAGMSETQVRRVLNLERKFDERGATILKEMLIEGRVSANKLARIAAVANAENQFFWATQVKLLPKSALETLVKDTEINYSRNESATSNIQTINPKFSQSDFGTNGLFKPKINEKSVPGHNYIERNSFYITKLLALNLSSEIIDKLYELKRKGFDLNLLIGELLQKRELEIAQEKERISLVRENDSAHSRYIPITVRSTLEKEYGDKCSIETCDKPSEEIHHTRRFSLSRSHNPKFLAPLCANHHKIAHTIDLQFHAARARAGP